MKRKLRRSLVLLLALVLLLPLLPARAEAESPVVYDAASYARFQRTPEEVAGIWNNALAVGPSYVNQDRTSYFTRPSSTVSPYDQGALTQDTLDHMVAMINALRWLSGAEHLKSGAGNDDSLQRCALIRNFDFRHTITDDTNKPADMSQALWDSGKGVPNHLLASGYTPESAVIGWVNEGYYVSRNEWGTLGHRYNLLEQDMSVLSFAYSGRVTAGAIKSMNNSTSLPFTAFPFPGPVPTELVYPGVSAWGLELNSAVFTVPNSGSELVVTVTNVVTGETYRCTKANGKLLYSTWNILDINFVQPACEGTRYAPGSVYEIVVSGLREKSSGKAAEIRYQVEYFSLEEVGTHYSITLNVGEHGSAACTSSSAIAGKSITVAAYPDEGYELGSVTWSPEGGSPVDITATRRFTMPAANVTVNVSFRRANPFVDVPAGSWYYTPVLWAYYHEPRITSGLDATHFGPDTTCTREQVVTFLWSAFGKQEPASPENPFSDVPEDAWYRKPVLWTLEKKITSGVGGGLFGVGQSCTRAQVVTFLWAAAEKPEPTSTANPFADVSEDDYFYKAVLWAVENGITKGMTADSFAPSATCTRAQVVTFLYAALDKNS